MTNLEKTYEVIKNVCTCRLHKMKEADVYHFLTGYNDSLTLSETRIIINRLYENHLITL